MLCKPLHHNGCKIGIISWYSLGDTSFSERERLVGSVNLILPNLDEMVIDYHKGYLNVVLLWYFCYDLKVTYSFIHLNCQAAFVPNPESPHDTSYFSSRQNWDPSEGLVNSVGGSTSNSLGKKSGSHMLDKQVN